MSEQGEGNGVKPGNAGKGESQAQKGAAQPGADEPAGRMGGEARALGYESQAQKGSARPGEAQGGAGEPAGRMGGEARALGYVQSQGVRVGWGRYLVAPRPVGLLAAGVGPVEASALVALLEEDPDVELLAQVRPSRSRGLGAIAEPHPACPPVAVVVMPQERARALAANPQVVVEADQPLSYTPLPAIGGLAGGGVAAADPALAVTLEQPEHVTVQIKGFDGDVVPGAHVWAVGTAATAHGVTGQDGRVSLQLAADTPATLQALYARPAAGYWPQRIDRPVPADGSEECVVQVRALADTFEGFPSRAVTGWGAQAMRLHQIPPTYQGHGIKIALLDSGVDAAHPDLKDTVLAGHDFTTSDSSMWRTDATGHGTWCAGVIGAADNRTGITGIAAEAELHALKLFPGGRVSDLLQAIDYCITHDIDLAQISLAYPVPSQLVAWKLLDAHAAGIAVIAPAGDTGNMVTPLAALPTVLAVGALAHTGTYPPDSPLAAVQPPWPGPYPAPFTPFGPSVDLTAPGAAVITTALGAGYTVADGTAIAAAHLTGLAALLLAHHDHLRTAPHPRTPARANHLMTLLRAASRPVPGADLTRQGAGLPDVPTALGVPLTVPAAV
jgi:hypothetical protein